MHTKRMPCNDEGRNQGDASTNQGIPKIASKPYEAMEETLLSPRKQSLT